MIHYTRDRIQQNALGFIAHLRSLIGGGAFRGHRYRGLFLEHPGRPEKGISLATGGHRRGHRERTPEVRRRTAQHPGGRGRHVSLSRHVRGQEQAQGAGGFPGRPGHHVFRRGPAAGTGEHPDRPQGAGTGLREDRIEHCPAPACQRRSRRRVRHEPDPPGAGPGARLPHRAEARTFEDGGTHFLRDRQPVHRNVRPGRHPARCLHLHRHVGRRRDREPPGHDRQREPRRAQARAAGERAGQPVLPLQRGQVGQFHARRRGRALHRPRAGRAALRALQDRRRPRDRVVELGDDAKRFISELWITRFSRQGMVH